MKAEDRGQLVRGVVGIGNHYHSGVTTNPAQAEEMGCLIAYTHWFRHDDDLSVLDRELESLVNCYGRMKQTSSMMYYYEYKDYKR